MAKPLTILSTFLFIMAISFASMACDYASKSYAEGSIIKQIDNELYTCISNRWVKNTDIHPIKIIVATYGNGDRRRTVTGIISGDCDGKITCTFPVNIDHFGGPGGDAGQPYDFWMKWQCGTETKDEHYGGSGTFTIPACH